MQRRTVHQVSDQFENARSDGFANCGAIFVRYGKDNTIDIMLAVGGKRCSRRTGEEGFLKMADSDPTPFEK